MKKILVVNNDLDTMSLLKNWLEKKTYQVKFTGNSDEVLSIVKNFKPDLILIDVTHKELISILKVHPDKKLVPILLMTGYVYKEISRKLPVDDSIEKPFNLDLFERKIQTLLLKTA